ncbi:MAG: DUF2207 domain-containing protein [Acidimicrobiia bacterium]|nr:DUF2207 domain-containing protein [Acidimicrobiia bacterium]
MSHLSRRRLFPLGLAVVGLLAALGVGSIAGAPPAAAQDRDFSIDEVRIEAELRPDGTLEVSEFLTYTFSGADAQPFTVGERSFRPDTGNISDAPGGTITSIQAYRDGEPLSTLLWTPTLFEWDIAPATSGTYTYELRYDVVGGITVGSDIVELYRQWVGDGFPQLDRWSAEITVPDGDGEVLVWAHGPLDGVIDTTGNVVDAEVPDVPAGQFVETRIAIPVERFDVSPGTIELLPDILTEEQAWADEANERREEVRRREELREDVQSFLLVVIAPIIGLAGVAFWLIWNKWGRDPAPPDDIGDYWREVPDDPPAVAVAFLNWNAVSADAYSATILDLARRGHMTIEEVPTERLLRKDTVEHTFTRSSHRTTDGLRPFENRAVQWLFMEGDTITQSELVERNREHQSAATSFWTGFQNEVKDDLKRRKYVVGGKGAAFALHVLLICALGAVGVLALAFGAWIPAAVALAGALVLIPFGFLLRSRTPAGTRRFTEWTALRRFLKDFSSLDEAPVGHLALWEHYLVAAVALGVADELIRGLETKFPELMDQSSGVGFAPWYIASSVSGHGRFGAMGSFSSEFGSAAVSSFTPASSGSGSGGGFSGGGGGGGGGGGAGAR